jgi:hypothetical protein
MGGSIGVTIRSNGQEWRMERWTNPLSEVLHNPDFLTETNGAVEAYLKTWLGMAEDWAAHGPKGPFTHPMTPVYAPYPSGLQPSEYGAIVVDFDNRIILECQGYTGVGVLDWHAFEYGPDYTQVLGEGHEDKVLRLEKAGRIRSFDAFLNTSHKDVLAEVLAFPGTTTEPSPVAGTVSVSIPTPQGLDSLRAYGAVLRARHKGRMGLPLRFIRLTIDMAPFSVESFNVDATGFTTMLQRVEDLGFHLTDAERAAWAERIADAS